MSEHITHLAVAEDSARLVSVDPGFSLEIMNCIREHPTALQWGSMSRSGDMFIFPTLSKWKESWTNKPVQRKQMAYILGWAGHLAADRTFKPVYRLTDLAYYVRGYPGPSHASVHHDAVIFREVYDSGKESPFHPSALQSNMQDHPASAYFPADRIEELFAMSFGSDLAGFKNFLTPDRDKERPFLENLEDTRQRFYVEIPRYTEAYYSPNSARLRKYILKPNFYDRRDPIIQLARAVQKKKDTSFAVNEVVKNTSEQSLYAQALALGHQFMMAASDYYTGKITEDEARVRMRTGTPHKEQLDYYIKLAENEN